MIFQPLLPGWLIVVLGAALLFTCLWKYRWKHRLLILRIPAALILIVMLANPVTQSYKETESKQQLAIIVDASESMGRNDTDSNQTRYALAKQQAEYCQSQLSELYLTQTYSLDTRMTSQFPQSVGGNTNFNALKSLTRLGNSVPKQVLFFSDGADWKDSNPESVLKASGIKVHTIGVGSRVGASNISIRAEAASPTVFPGQNLPISCEITASDDVVGRETEWIFVSIDSKGKEEELFREVITLKKHQRKTLVSKIGNVIGGRLWRAYINKLPNEEHIEDNVSFVSAQVVDKQINILVIQGQPYWDTSIAVRAWRRDQQLRVTSWYALGKKVYRSGHDIGTQLDRAALKKIDILVLGTHLDVFVKGKQIEEIKRFINAGGNVLVIGPGKRLNGALDDVLPIKSNGRMKDNGQFSLTTIGKRLDLLNADIHNLSPIKIGGVSSVNPHALIYAGSKQEPIVLSARQGGGKITCVNAEELWKWRLAHRGEGDNPASFFWRQLIRTMSRQVNGVFITERSQYFLGQEALIKIRSSHIDSVTYIDPQKKQRTLSVNDQQLSITLDQAGLHILKSGEERLLLVARKDNAEQIRCARDNKRLQRLASLTNGEFHDIHESDQLVERMLQEQLLSQSREVTSKPSITGSFWLIMLFMLLGIEWTLRRTTYGMV